MEDFNIYQQLDLLISISCDYGFKRQLWYKNITNNNELDRIIMKEVDDLGAEVHALKAKIADYYFQQKGAV
jgi:hypothetical protein